MNKKKIAFIGAKGIPAQFDGIGGIEVRLEKIARELVKKGWQVDVFVRNWAVPKELKQYKGINLIHLPTINTKHGDASIHSLLASIYVCFKDYQLVFYEAVGPAFFCFMAKLFKKKIITTIHCLDWQRDKWGWLAKLFLKMGEKVAIKLSDKIIVVSDHLQNYYQKQNIVTELIPNVTDKKGKFLAQIIKEKYNLGANDYILYLGRFVPEKRIEWLIKAFKTTSSDKKLILAGGPSHSRTYVNKLKKLAAKDRRIIFTGYVFDREKEELLSNAFLFVQPSKLEGSSISLIEAISYRKPFLAADIVSNRELAADKSFLFKTNSFYDFKDKLAKMLKKKKISFKKKKGFVNKGWEKTTEKIIEIVKSIK